MTDQKNNQTATFLQIILPLILMIVGVGVAVYFLAFSPTASSQTISQSGDIAAIFLVFLFIVPVLITIALITILIILTMKTKNAVSSASIGIAEKFSQINASVRKISTSAATPFVEIDARVHMIKQIFSKKD